MECVPSFVLGALVPIPNPQYVTQACCAPYTARGHECSGVFAFGFGAPPPSCLHFPLDACRLMHLHYELCTVS